MDGHGTTGHGSPLQIDRRALGLRELSPRRGTAPHTRAALALMTWINPLRPARGIHAPRLAQESTVPSGPNNNATFRVFHPLPDQGRCLVAYLFIDQSALVSLRPLHGVGPEIVLPVVFRLRQSHRRGEPWAHVGNPDRHHSDARISFRERASDTGGPSWDNDALDAAAEEDNRHPTLERIRDDTVALLPFWDELPWVCRPAEGPLPDGPIAVGDLARLKLPEDALGARAYWPDDLPQSRLSTPDRAALLAYTQDFANWVGMCYGAHMDGISVILRQTSPDSAERKGRKNFQPDISVRWMWNNAFLEGTTRPRHASGHPRHLLAEPARFVLPVQADRLIGFKYGQGSGVKPKIVEPILVSAQPDEISGHGRFALLSRFGKPRKDLIDKDASA